MLTVLATDLKITGGLQGLLGPAFPDFPDSLAWLGAPVAWCVMLGLLLCAGIVWNIRQSPLYPVLLSIRDAERFAEAAGVRTSLIKIGVFGVSAAMAGGAGWLFSFLGVVSPGQFDWSVSLNILVMVLIGGINTTLGPVIGAAFVSMFPALVNINPWLQEMVYGALSILAVTLLPGGVMSLLKLAAPRARDAGGGRLRPQKRRPRSRSRRASSEDLPATSTANPRLTSQIPNTRSNAATSVSATRTGRPFYAT